VARVGFVVVLKKAIWSFRLRLHSGLRQQCRPSASGVMRPKAEALGYLFVTRL